MNHSRIWEAMGFIDEDLIAGAIAYQPKRRGDHRKGLIMVAAIIMMLAALSVAVYALYPIIKELNLFQKAAAEGVSISEVDTAGDFRYTKPESNTQEITKEEVRVHIPEGFADLKTDIYNKMLNTVDYLGRVSAVAVTNMNGGNERIITYHFDVDAVCSYQSVSEDNRVISETFSNISNGMTAVYHAEKMYVENYQPVYSKKDTPYIPLNERITVEEDGIPCYYYRRNITNCPLASYSLVPQEITFSYLKDFELWTIENESSAYLERPCVVICGKPSPYIGAKHSIDSFEMIVDRETGVLLRFAGTNQGAVVMYSEITQIDYQDEETIRTFNKDAYPEYTSARR